MARILRSAVLGAPLFNNPEILRHDPATGGEDSFSDPRDGVGARELAGRDRETKLFLLDSRWPRSEFSVLPSRTKWRATLAGGI
jgi:hypothetical protein